MMRLSVSRQHGPPLACIRSGLHCGILRYVCANSSRFELRFIVRYRLEHVNVLPVIVSVDYCIRALPLRCDSNSGKVVSAAPMSVDAYRQAFDSS